jgi:hypothetical protein
VNGQAYLNARVDFIFLGGSERRTVIHSSNASPKLKDRILPLFTVRFNSSLMKVVRPVPVTFDQFIAFRGFQVFGDHFVN